MDSGLHRVRRKMRRVLAGIYAGFHRPVEVGIGHLQVVPHRHLGRVAKPCGSTLSSIQQTELAHLTAKSQAKRRFSLGDIQQ